MIIFLGLSYNAVVWQFAEMFLIVVLGSIPAIKPLFEAWFNKPETPQNSHELSSTSKMKGSYQTHSRGVDIEGLNESVPSDEINLV